MTTAQSPAADRRPSLLDIADMLSAVSSLVDAAWMASGDLDEGERDPLRAVLDIVAKKLKTAREALDEWRPRPQT
jgi:hypothetical protein